MKRIIKMTAFALVLAGVMAFAGCGGRQEEKPGPAPGSNIENNGNATGDTQIVVSDVGYWDIIENMPATRRLAVKENPFLIKPRELKLPAELQKDRVNLLSFDDDYAVFKVDRQDGDFGRITTADLVVYDVERQKVALYNNINLQTAMVYEAVYCEGRLYYAAVDNKNENIKVAQIDKFTNTDIYTLEKRTGIINEKNLQLYCDDDRVFFRVNENRYGDDEGNIYRITDNTYKPAAVGNDTDTTKSTQKIFNVESDDGFISFWELHDDINSFRISYNRTSLNSPMYTRYTIDNPSDRLKFTAAGDNLVLMRKPSDEQNAGSSELFITSGLTHTEAVVKNYKYGADVYYGGGDWLGVYYDGTVNSNGLICQRVDLIEIDDGTVKVYMIDYDFSHNTNGAQKAMGEDGMLVFMPTNSASDNSLHKIVLAEIDD